MSQGKTTDVCKAEYACVYRCMHGYAAPVLIMARVGTIKHAHFMLLGQAPSWPGEEGGHLPFVLPSVWSGSQQGQRSVPHSHKASFHLGGFESWPPCHIQNLCPIPSRGSNPSDLSSCPRSILSQETPCKETSREVHTGFPTIPSHA